jgi:hypothetical protein
VHLLVHDLLEVVRMNVPRIGMWTRVEAGNFHQHFLDCYSFEESVCIILSQIPVAA